MKTYEDGYRDGWRDGVDAFKRLDEGTRPRDAAPPQFVLKGCQCPAGAELSCQSSGCGRRSYSYPSFGPTALIVDVCNGEQPRN